MKEEEEGLFAITERREFQRGNNVNKKRRFMGNSPDIGSKKGFVVVKTRGGTRVGGKGGGRNARLMV